jgi:hypothetical protein
MMSDLVPLLAQVSPNHQIDMGLVFGLGSAVATFIIVLAWIVASAWTQIHRLRLESPLKQQMIDRGMSAEDIVAVLNNQRPGEGAVGHPRASEGAVEPPCASEAVVEIDDEWQTALILKREGDRYFVHVVGTEMSDNQWVTSDRVRFPATSHDRCASPMDWSFLGSALGAGDWCGKAGRSKPAPVDQEL